MTIKFVKMNFPVQAALSIVWMPVQIIPSGEGCTLTCIAAINLGKIEKMQALKKSNLCCSICPAPQLLQLLKFLKSD
jgi:hypothetical protein